ncbi:MAG: antibiotic biosynthesis monooxygenase [Halobacteriota archaeon]|jgi:antibiotic biosynthesis monooxygenase (ABM) superfamily enzyme
MDGTTKASRHADSGPVTVIIRRRIKRGFATAYEQLEKEISADAAANPGYLGSTFLRPEGGGDRDFVTIVRFASYENMMQWEHSTTGSALINRADAMSELPATISRTAGLSLWFNPRHPASPQRWKMVLILTVSIFILAQLITPLLDPALRLLPQPLAFFISLAIQVALLTYFVLPWLTALLAKWLYDVPRAEE